MDIGKTLNDSLEYAKDAVWGKWVRWLLLIVSSIIFPLIMGYEVEIYRGKKPAPELENWGKLFVDGLKLFIIQIIYMIPVLVLLFVFIGAGAFMFMYGSPGAALAGFGSIMGGILITVIVAVIIALIAVMGAVRFACTGSMGEAFNFSAILAHIGKIGWLSYIAALVVLVIVAGIIAFILAIIPFIGIFLILIASPAIAIFSTRYITLLYDSVPEAAAPPTAPPAA